MASMLSRLDTCPSLSAQRSNSEMNNSSPDGSLTIHSLHMMPQEILDRLFDFLSVRDLWLGLRPVCRRFNNALHRDSYWLLRVRKFGVQLPDRLLHQTISTTIQKTKATAQPSSANSDDGRLFMNATSFVHWGLAIVQAVDWWTGAVSSAPPSAPSGVSAAGVDPVAIISTNHLEDFIPKPVAIIDTDHYGTIDAVKVFRTGRKRFCLTGARDRIIALWDLEAASDRATPKAEWSTVRINDAHDGWIWCLATSPDGTDFYSASWDNSIKQWHIGESTLMAEQRLQFKEAVLSCATDVDSLLYASTFRRGPILFDLRSGPLPQQSLICHSMKPVYEMITKADCPLIFSIGDDNSLVSVDKRMFRVVSQRSFNHNALSHLDYHAGLLAVALRDSTVKFLNPTTLEFENKVDLLHTTSLYNKQANRRCENNSSQQRFNRRQQTQTVNLVDGPDIGPRISRTHPCIRLTAGATFCAGGHTNALQVFTPGLRPRLVCSVPIQSPTTKFLQLDYFRGDLVVSVDTGSLLFFNRLSTF